MMKLRATLVALTLALSVPAAAGTAHAATNAASKPKPISASFKQTTSNLGATIIGNKMLFTHDKDLYSLTVGGGAKTAPKLIKRINNLDGSNIPAQFEGKLGKVAFFSTANSVWRTDGTPAGTYQLHFGRGQQETMAAGTFSVIGGVAYFYGHSLLAGNSNSGKYGYYQTDGTINGTKEFTIGSKRLARLWVVERNWNDTVITDGKTVVSLGRAGVGAWMKGKYYYSRGTQVWRTNGTRAGTVRVKGLKIDHTTDILATSNRIYFQTTKKMARGHKASVMVASNGTKKGTHVFSLKGKTSSKRYVIGWYFNTRVANNKLYVCGKVATIFSRTGTTVEPDSKLRWMRVGSSGKLKKSKARCDGGYVDSQGGTLRYVLPNSGWTKFQLMSLSLKTAFK